MAVTVMMTMKPAASRTRTAQAFSSPSSRTKLQLLFGLIFISQYFTSVTTSHHRSGRSSESRRSESTAIFPTLSLSVSSSSVPSFSSLAAEPTLSHHSPSSPIFFSSTSAITTKRHFLKRTRNGEFQLVPTYYFDFPAPTGSQGRNESGLWSAHTRASSTSPHMLMVGLLEEKEVPTPPLTTTMTKHERHQQPSSSALPFLRKMRQHQKRQVVSGVRSASDKGHVSAITGNKTNNNNNNGHHHRLVMTKVTGRDKESESERNGSEFFVEKNQNSNLLKDGKRALLISSDHSESSKPLYSNGTTGAEITSGLSTAASFQPVKSTGSGGGNEEALGSGGGGGNEFRPMCRHKGYFPPDIFRLDTCAWCYRYVKNDSTRFGSPSKKLYHSPMLILDPDSNRKYVILGIKDGKTGKPFPANISDPDSPIWSTFETEKARKDWTGCCGAAEECCERMVASAKPSELDGSTAMIPMESQERECPPTWDGWQCWNSTKPGVVAESFCPNYVYFLTEAPACTMPLVKQCDSNGTWMTYGGKEWTNYSICSMSKVMIQRNRSYVLVIAYAISIVALVPACLIFFSFKQLRVHRIILHQNLFFSLILNGLLVIIFNTTVMMREFGGGGDSTTRQNSVACRLLLISTKYSRMTNYMWMLCEGFYLHKLIAAAFAEQKSLLVFYLIGWVFPLFPTAFYAGYRILAANDECWVVPQDEWEWALNGPSLLSLLVNTLFLINIIRVLVTKLRAHAQEPSQYRKAVRATLVLLPLFGLHFIVTIYRPSSSTGVCQNWTELYFYANDVLDGTQGFLVALIFCYCNGEVLSLLKRAYSRWREQHFDVGHNRQNSRHRPSRGSVMGRSVVSTHIYSSIPPSPETNVIAVPLPSGGGGDKASSGSIGSNSISHDPSPTAHPGTGSNLLTVNGTSAGGIVTIPTISNSNNKVSPNNERKANNSNNPEQLALKNLKNNHNSTTTATANGNAINLYVSSEYGSVKNPPGVEISCV